MHVEMVDAGPAIWRLTKAERGSHTATQPNGNVMRNARLRGGGGQLRDGSRPTPKECVCTTLHPNQTK